MANQKNIDAKAALSATVQEKIQNAQSVVVVDYRGFTVTEVSELRANMRKAGVEYAVLKNTIVERAAKDANIDESFMAQLKGPSAFAFGVDDVVAPARILKEFIKKVKKGEIKGGLINGSVSDAKMMNALADLPSREVLLSKLLGSMKAPISSLAIALNRVKEKMEAANAATAADVVVAKEAAPAPVVETTEAAAETVEA